MAEEGCQRSFFSLRDPPQADSSALSSLDPVTGYIVTLYHPRRQRWGRHFRLNGARIKPLTAAGRATEQLLRLNDQWCINERLALLSLGQYPRGEGRGSHAMRNEMRKAEKRPVMRFEEALLIWTRNGQARLTKPQRSQRGIPGQE